MIQLLISIPADKTVKEGVENPSDIKASQYGPNTDFSTKGLLTSSL